ncbi:gamma-glutamylcyclotransferase [Haloechinothrix sp. LS1_15]|uniref:allophanate hydrolase-related protein n=1 Tax=Haloechinothrix sp. LS1_15 TaxID=2652248 RepID=UPI0037BFEA55
MFLNGGGMRGGPLHHQLRGAPLVRQARTAPKYRFYAVDDRFPALEPVSSGGVAVAGELYDLPMETLRDSLLPAEPRELELSVIELDDGSPSLAVVLRREFRLEATLTDISHLASWREYQRD